MTTTTETTRPPAAGSPRPARALAAARAAIGRRAALLALAAALAALLALAAPPAAGQQRPPAPELTPEVIERAVALYNRPGTVRLAGEAVIPAGSEVAGDVAVLGGPVTVAGRIRGRLLVINGSVRFAPGARVEGDVTVIGGEALGAEQAAVQGGLAVYREALRYRREDGLLAYAGLPRDPELSAGRQFAFGRTHLTLAVRGGYNRVEGLPIAAGARLELGGSNPARLEALLIYRTESGLRLDEDELGYTLRAEQGVGGRRAVRLGAALFSEIRPIEPAGLSDRENSLATFFLHRDFRDHYERAGWTASLRIAPRDRPYDLQVEYRDETHRTIAAGAPWTLFDNDGEWRPQPFVAEGELRSIAATLGYDTRNETLEPAAGWAITAALEVGLGGRLEHPVRLDPATGRPALERTPADARFTAGLSDVHRYVRTGPGSRIAIRAFAAGSLDGEPLPPQRQHALGGVGSLPAYRPFAFDCDARAHTLGIGGDGFVPESRFHPYYGCDRVALFQLEYQLRLPFGRDLGRRLASGIDLGPPPSLVLFFDAGRSEECRVGKECR